MNSLILRVFLVVAVIAVDSTFAQDKGKKPSYKKWEVAQARYGDEERRRVISNARKIKETLSRNIIGQDRALKAVQERVVQYLEGYGTRLKDPVALHLIGFPGIGKSAIIQALSTLGIELISLDAQKYTDEERAGWQVSHDLQTISEKCAQKPCIVMVDELDKLPEYENGKLVTRTFIGAINQILTDGVYGNGTEKTQFSNVLVMTTMNFSPDDIERYSKDALGVEKTFYEFSIDDFTKYDQWLNTNRAARYLVLKHIFRSNTVSRLAPNTVILKPLTRAEYEIVAKNNINKTIARATTGNNAKKHLTVTFTDHFLQFMVNHAVFAPSGARETVFKVDALVDQIIITGAKAKNESKQKSLDLPRDITMDINSDETAAVVTVIPRMKRGKEWVKLEPIKFEMKFDPNSNQFEVPEIVSDVPPASIDDEGVSAGVKKVTQAEIKKTRFPKIPKEVKKLAKYLNTKLIGQEAVADLLQQEMTQFLSRTEPAKKEPMYKIFAGFPGIGKSELINQTGAFLELPIVRINMQQYSSDESDSVEGFIAELKTKVAEAKEARPDHKFILLIEEMDKTFEVHPQSRAIINRPIMALIKDLLSEGKLTTQLKEGSWGEPEEVEIDVRNAYTAVTMNFASSIFEFKADPRLTTTEDILDAYRALSSNLTDLRNVLERIYLPETISRILPGFVIIKPLTHEEYTRVIDLVPGRVERDRMMDKDRERNVAGISIMITDGFKEYLANETIIPSEGARYTVMSGSKIIADNIEKAIANFDKKSAYSKKNVDLILDFNHKNGEVIASVKVKGESVPAVEVYRHKPRLVFPPFEIKGKIPADRMFVAVHEFGHAFSAIRLGLRIETGTVISPEAGTGGYVKYKEGGFMKAKELIARLYSALASRAMERIFLGKNPTDKASVADISIGSSSDIASATNNLFNQLFALGMDANGGTIFHDNDPQHNPGQSSNFADLSQSKIDAMGKIMRRMEDMMVDDFLKAFPREWYIEKIETFARKGTLTEKDFYKLLDFKYPGANDIFIGAPLAIHEKFGAKIEKFPKSVLDAMEFKQGEAGKTAIQNMDAYVEAIQTFFAEEMHHKKTSQAKGRCAKKVVGK